MSNKDKYFSTARQVVRMAARQQSPSIEVLLYGNPISITNCATDKDRLKNFCSVLIKHVSQRIGVKILTTLPIIPASLEQYNIRYTEKWIRNIDANFLDYNLAVRKPALITPYRKLPRNLRYLHYKYFSGDVSGMIAESIFINLLDHLGVNVNLVGHLRPLKSKGEFLPDFVIWDQSSALTRLVTSGSFNVPVFAEVKSSTESLKKSQLAKAITQLKKVLSNQNQCGLIFYLYKASSIYKGVIFEVRV